MDEGLTCKLWWPEERTFSAPDRGIFLFGWCFDSGGAAVDVVVAAGISDDSLCQSNVEEVLFNINKMLSVSPSDYPLVTLLGHCGLAFDDENSTLSHQQKSIFPGDSNGRSCFSETRKDVMSKRISCDCPNLKYDGVSSSEQKVIPGDSKERSCFLDTRDVISKSISDYSLNQKYGGVSSSKQRIIDDSRLCSCDCPKLNNHFEHHRKSSARYNDSWIQLISEPQEFSSKSVRWIPKLHHLHQNGQWKSVRHLHVIIYKPPTPDDHHLSLSTWNSQIQTQTPFRIPNWLDELQKKNLLLDLEAVMMSLNCSNAVKDGIEGCFLTRNGCNKIPIRSILTRMCWHILAISVASVSTIIYIIIWACHRFLVCGAPSFLFIIFSKLFQHASIHAHVRCSQFQYWPAFLLGSGTSFQPHVGHAHEAALKRHALWSSIVIDVFLGNIVGLLMMIYTDSIYLSVSNVASNITDNLLRSGCVWLMGVPAGFKLNTELAELFGMISLNAIQIWSTFWFFMGLAFVYVVNMLALSGIFLGLTVPAALCVDILKLGTFHISCLHKLISFLYSHQIQALASLWRLFRGRKWNPLRQRLDSFDYTVEEHVVGSLLFTPILLLLPTTTVFYIFFTIMNLIVDFSCIIIEFIISIEYAVPYAEIFLWILRRGRFPCGVWFEVMTSQGKNSSLNLRFFDHSSPPSNMSLLNRSQIDSSIPSRTIYVLHSNFANIGQILRPHLKKVFNGFSLASSKACVYGILGGQREPGILRTFLPPTMPWINLSFTEYWRLCRSSVIGSVHGSTGFLQQKANSAKMR